MGTPIQALREKLCDSLCESAALMFAVVEILARKMSGRLRDRELGAFMMLVNEMRVQCVARLEQPTRTSQKVNVVRLRDRFPEFEPVYVMFMKAWELYVEALKWKEAVLYHRNRK